jgi:type I restriction enzyme S subunit
MEAEIQAFEARLGKARAFKQGMMQSLLTGRVRLPGFAPAEKFIEAAERARSASPNAGRRSVSCAS